MAVVALEAGEHPVDNCLAETQSSGDDLVVPDPFRIAFTAESIDALGPIVTAVDLARVGVTKGAIDAAVQGGAVRALRRGVYVSVATWDHADVNRRVRLAASAACRAYPEAAVAFESAARIHGLSLLDDKVMFDADGVPLTTMVADQSKRSGWLTVRREGLPPMTTVHVGAVRCTSIQRTAVDVARTASPEAGIVILDSAMRMIAEAMEPRRDVRSVMIDANRVANVRRAFGSVVEHMRGGHGVARVQALLDLAEPASESVLESVSRLRMHQAGLPAAECGQPVVGADGRRYWVGFLWRDRRVIGEADGLLKYEDIGALRAEKIRQEALERAGYRVVRWRWSDVRGGRLAERVAAALERAAA